METCSQVNAKGNQCRNQVGGILLDFCTFHANMVKAGKPQFCRRCGHTVQKEGE